MELSNWNGVPRPQRIVLDGRYARLEPLDPTRHENELLESALEPGSNDRFRYLFEDAPGDGVIFRSWIDKAARSDDPLSLR
jgi:hypothetical protein